MTPNDLNEQRIALSDIDPTPLSAGSITIDPSGIATGRIAPQPEAEDLFRIAHEVAAAHIETCWMALNDEIDDDDEPIRSPASEPFCGCQDCETREILHAAWPLLRRAALAGYPEGSGRH